MDCLLGVLAVFGGISYHRAAEKMEEKARKTKPKAGRKSRRNAAAVLNKCSRS